MGARQTRPPVYAKPSSLSQTESRHVFLFLFVTCGDSSLDSELQCYFPDVHRQSNCPQVNFITFSFCKNPQLSKGKGQGKGMLILVALQNFAFIKRADGAWESRLTQNLERLVERS